MFWFPFRNRNKGNPVDDRIVDPHEIGTDIHPEDEGHGRALRPASLDSFIGQRKVRDNLAIFIAAARDRGEVLDHVLLSGPPGLGKTTLAQIVAREMGVGFRPTSAPTIQKPGELAALLGSLQPQDVLFIDEIHRLHPAVEEILYTAMEDFQLDLIIGEGPSARSVRIDLPPFTLVGATTRAGAISRPLRERFGIPLHLEFYDQAELELIAGRAARLLGIAATADGLAEIACRARGTPRISGRLLRRVRDYVQYAGLPVLDGQSAAAALDRLEVDRLGLDAMDRRYLRLVAEGFGGGPVGVETLGAALGEQRDVLEEVVEPYLIQQGLLQRTPRGRLLTANAWRYLGLAVPELPARRDAA
ncbi:Holliday junction branch migration DNA helicase RuvB [Arenibaculum pallidiluteum]|uniref:Holliday junction branch migration DNA helicase RuvB n=1 Tax=Arenibaculum pallidiluteum TaxID=2812559 RepID=UPI001A9596CA